jgi:hypothetical protein
VRELYALGFRSISGRMLDAQLDRMDEQNYPEDVGSWMGVDSASRRIPYIAWKPSFPAKGDVILLNSFSQLKAYLQRHNIHV